MKNTNGKNVASWWSKTKKRMSKDKEAPELEQNEATAETAATADNMTAESTDAAGEISAASELDKLRAEKEELNQKFLYLMSEFENYKRRTAKERLELFKTASKDLIIELLPVLDDFERGLQVMETAQDVASVKTGVELVYNKFRLVMVGKGLSPIDAAGNEFDPELHEAISQAPAGPESVNKVVQEVERGYRLHDTVVRYAKVIVGV